MKKTTPLRVFASIYFGLFLAGILALVIDIFELFGFRWLYHVYYAHGWFNNFTDWVRFTMSYGLLGLPIVWILSHFSAWLVNLFERVSIDTEHLESSKPNWRRSISKLCWVALVFISSYSLMTVFFLAVGFV